MRHCKHTVRLGRQRSHYKATMRSLVSSLIVNKSISTTKVKAKEASRLADKLVTLGKDNRLANQRKAYSILYDRDLISILFKEIAPLFKERKGGYTRVMLTGRRRGDNAQMAILEFVEKPKIEPVMKKEGKKKPKAIQPEPKTKVSKTGEKERVKPKKEPIVKKKEEPKKVICPPEKPEEPKPEKPKPEKPKEAKPRPGFFKRLFGRKKAE